MQWLNDFMAKANQQIGKFKNASFRDGVLATCALVSAADGQVTSDEKTKVAKLIQTNQLLSVFDGAELRDGFLAYVDKAGDEFTRLDVLNAVRKLKSNPEQAETAVKVALIVANADGDFSQSEKNVVKEICVSLGLPSEPYIG